MKFLNKLLNVVPGASLVQAAVQGRRVVPSDFLPGSKLIGGELLDKAVANKPSSAASTNTSSSTNRWPRLPSAPLTTPAPLFPRLFNRQPQPAPLTTSALRSAPVEEIANTSTTPEDNTMLYIAGGVGGIVVIGSIIYILKD
jgi:hypothetical protein